MSENSLKEKNNNNGTPSDNSNNNVVVDKNVDTPKDDISDNSLSSAVSSVSSKSVVSKQSGIRPPSRIGRPCGGIHKPAIPATPTKNSSDDSIRRINDDLGRHRLTDLIEADEKEEDGLDYLNSARRKRFSSIASTASSMDGLWELHPRRLSEAGLSRHSDSSAVLTEDTDSFIIGQRVWVGGTKPGTIAYIGETQFAPGDWAGIALDEPIGKNDGSVGGIRYFQCENKKGVFSRLTRLTRVPLEQPGMGSNETFTSPNNGVRKSPISPTGSTKSLLKSATSLSNSNTSLTSTATHVDFKIGDRVIIKSTQGSKVGTVRYMGLTDFAPGEWVGVELDDPRGKNDGSVEGRRYFECRPNFGLFAPMSKVSKSPSKHKPSACVVHSGQGLPPSGLKRTNSKESLASLTSKTSAASSVRRVRLGVTSLSPKKVSPKTSTPLPTRTALQDVLREKQQHIEQLLKERDLERAEVTRAANQADEAEQRFFTLKQEFEKYRAECEEKVRQNSEILDELKINRDELLSHLEDEKRKNEDLQFRFEEASITKGDIEVINETNGKKILELEKNLAEERQKTELLEQTSNKLFEAEENLIKAREEIDNLRNEMEKTKSETSAIDKERADASSLVESLQKQLERTRLENDEKNNVLSRMKEEMAIMKSDHELFKREVDEFKEKSENNCKEKDEQMEKLKSELDDQQHIVKKFESTHQELLKENEKLKMQLSARTLDLETANERVADKEREIKSLQDTLMVVQKQLDERVDELERYKNNALDFENSIRKELEQTRADLKEKISEVEKVKEQLNIQISKKNQQLQDANKTISQDKEDIKKLNDELAEVKTNFEVNKNEIHSRHARQVASQDSQLMALSAELQQKNEEITKSSIVISKLEEDLCTKNGVIEKLRLELESHGNQQSNHNEASATLTQKVNELSVSNGDLQRQVTTANERIAALMEIKQRLETEIQTLSVKCENSEQLAQFRNEIQAKHNLLETLKAEYEQKLHNSERIRHQVELQQQTVTANFERVRAELETKLQVSMQSEELLKQRCDNAAAEFAKIRDECRIKVSELERLVQEKEFALSNIQDKSSEAVMRYQDQLKSVTEELHRSLQDSQHKISLLNNENSQLKEQVSTKSEELIEAHAKTSHVLAQSQQSEKELKQKYNEDIKRLEFELNEKTLLLEKTMTELQLLRNDCHTTNTDLGAKDQKISELTAEIQQAQTLVSQLQEQLTSTKSLHQQTTEEHEMVQNQCHGLLEKVASLTEQVRNGEEVFKNLQIEHNNAMHLVSLLKVTEQQKQNCLKQLQQEVTVTSENKSCDHVIALLNQVKVDNNTEDAQRNLVLQKDVEIVRNQLAERNHQFDIQKSELLRLQEELLRAQESNARCTEGSQPDNNSVSSNDTHIHMTQHKVLHASLPSNPLELQMQLITLKTSFLQLSDKFENLRNQYSHLLARLHNALNNKNDYLINESLKQLAQVNEQYKTFRYTMQSDNFNLQKIIQYSVLQLQEKDRILNEQKIIIKNFQEIIRNLPMQCKSFALLKENDVSFSECSNLKVDNKRLDDLLQAKDQQVQQLKTQVSYLLNECSFQQYQQKLSIQQPCVCPESYPQLKKVHVISPSPPKIVRINVPVIQPKIVVKEVIVPQVNGQRCPSPKIEKVEIPKFIVQKIPVKIPVPSQCTLPDLTSLYGCDYTEDSVNQLILPNYNALEIFKFKQTLKSLIMRQRNCVVSTCTHLPVLRIPDTCLAPSAIVNSLNFKSYGSVDIDTYKESLLQLLKRVQDCATQEMSNSRISQLQNVINHQSIMINNLKKGVISCPQLPSLVVTDTCISPAKIVDSITLNGYSASDISNYKQSLLQVLYNLEKCSFENKSSEKNINNKLVFHPSLIENCVTPQLPSFQVPESCLSPHDYIQSLVINGYNPSQIELFKLSLSQLISKFQMCQQSPRTTAGTVHSAARNGSTFGECLPKLPTLQDCITPPDIINQLNLDSFIKWESDLFKQTLLELLTLQQKCCSTRTTKIIEKPVFVRIPIEVPKFIEQIRQVPVKIPVLQPPEVIIKKVPVLQPPKFVIKHIPILVPQPPRVITKEIPISTTSECKPIIQQIPVKIPVPVKIKVPVQVLMPIEKQCRLPSVNVFDCSSPVHALNFLDLSIYKSSDVTRFKQELLLLINTQRDCSPKVLTKTIKVPVPTVQKVPIYIPQRPQIIIKEVPQPTSCKCNLPDLSFLHGCVTPGMVESILTPSSCSHADVISFKETFWRILAAQKSNCSSGLNCPPSPPPKLLIKQVAVPVPSPPKVIVKEVAVPISRGNMSNIIIKEKPIPVPSPPRIITKQIPVKIPIEVKVPVEVPVIRKQIVEVPKIIVKEIKIPINVPIPVRIFQPPKILIKEIPVPVLQPPKVIMKQIPLIINKTIPKPMLIYKDRIVQIPSPPRTIIKEVPVKIKVPIRIPVPVEVKLPIKIPVPYKVEVPMKCHLPDININSCLDVAHQIDSLALENYNSVEVARFKQKLYLTLLQQRDCVQCHLPDINVNGCLELDHQISSLDISGYNQWDVHKFKNNLLSLLLQQRNCTVPSECRLPGLDVLGCTELKEQIDSLYIPGYQLSDINAFKQKLLAILLQQRKCVLPAPCQVKESKLPVFVPQPPKIIVKQVQVPVPQSPVKMPIQVEAPLRCRLPDININGCIELQQQIRLTDMPGYDLPEVAKFKEKLLRMLLEQRNCIVSRNHCPVRQVRVRVPIPIEVPKIIVKEVRVPTPVETKVPKKIIKYIKVPVNVPVYRPQVPKILIRHVEVPVPQPPKVIIKEIPVVISKCNQKPRIIIREKPVTIPLPPRIITKEIPVKIQIPVSKECHLPRIHLNSCVYIKNAIESLSVTGYSATETARFKHDLLSMLLDHRNCIKQPKCVAKIMKIPVLVPKEVIKEIKVPVFKNVPAETRKEIPVPKVIVKQVIVPKEIKIPVYRKILVPVPQTVEVPKEVRVPVRVSIPQIPKIFVKQVRVPVFQPPQVIVKEVPVIRSTCNHTPMFTMKPVTSRTIVKEVPIKVPIECHLPVINIKTCIDIQKEISALKIFGYSSEEVAKFKQNLLFLLLQQKDCMCPNKKIGIPINRPIYHNIPLPGQMPKEVVKEIKIPVYQKVPVKVLVPIKQVVEVPKYTVKEVVKIVRVPMKQLVEVPREIIKEVKVPVYQKVFIKVPVPRHQIVTVPKEIVKEIKIPVYRRIPIYIKQIVPKELLKVIKVPVKVPVRQSPQILLKQVPVPVPQPPRIIVKQVPIIISKCDQKPNIIVQQKPVPYRLPPRLITKEVPVRVTVPLKVPVFIRSKCQLPAINIHSCIDLQNEISSLIIPGYNSEEVAAFKRTLFLSLLQQRSCLGCKLPQVDIVGCDNLENQIESISISNYKPWDAHVFKKKLLSLLLNQRYCLRQPKCTPKIIKIPVDRPVYHRIPVEVPKQIVKEIKIPVYQKVPVKMPVHIKDIVQVPKYIVKEVVKQVRVPVKQFVEIPKEVIKKVLVEIPKEIIKKVAVPVKIMVPQPPKVLIKEVVVSVPQPPKIIVKQVPVPIAKGDKTRIIVKEKPVIIHIPPRIITKEIPVKIKIPVSVPVKQECHLPILNIDTCEDLQHQVATLAISGYDSNEVEQFKRRLLPMLLKQRDCVQYKCPTKIIKVPVDRPVNIPVRIPVFKKQVIEIPKVIKVPVFKRIPIKVPVEVKVPVKQIVEVPKIITKEVKIPFNVPVSVRIPSPPKILIKQVPVPVPQSPKIIVKQVPIIISKCNKKPRIIVKERPVPIQLPSRTLFKEIPVKVNIPVRVPVQVPPPPKMECRLPNIHLYRCDDLQGEIGNLQFPNYNAVEVIKFKQDLLSMLLQQRNCQPPRIITKEIPMKTNIPVPALVKRQCHLPIININTCEDLRHQVDTLAISGYDSYEVEQFKRRLLPMLLKQRDCVQYKCPTKIIKVPVDRPINIPVRIPVFKKQVIEIPKVIKVPVFKRIPIKVPVEVKVPVKQIVEVPKIITKEVKIPFNVPVSVRIPSPPKILIKQVPVPVPQLPKIIVKQVPIIISKCNQKPRIIVKERPVPIQLPPRTVFKEIPVKVNIPVRVPVQVPPPPKMECHLPDILLYKCDDLPGGVANLQFPNYNDVEVIKFKQDLLSMLLQQRNCNPPRDCQVKPFYIRVPIAIPKVEVKKIKFPVAVPVPIRIPLPPKILVKQVPFPVPQQPKIIVRQVPVMEKCDHKSKIIVKEKPVPVQLPPRTITREIPVKVNIPVKVPVEVKVPFPVQIPTPVRVFVPFKPDCHLPILNIYSCWELEKQIQNLAFSNDYDSKEVTNFRQNLLAILNQVKNCMIHTSKPVIKTKCHLPSIDVYGCENVENQILALKITGYDFTEIGAFKKKLLSLLLQQRECVPSQPDCRSKVVQVPVDKPIYVRVPVRIPVPIKYPVPIPKLVNKVIRIPVRIPVRVSVPLPSKVIVKQVPVYITSKPKTIVKQVPVYITPKTNVVLKQVPIPIQLPPRTIITQVPTKVIVPMKVPVPINVPLKIPIRVQVPVKTPFAVPVPVKYFVDKPVPIRVPVEIPKIVTKTVREHCPPSKVQYRVIEKPIYIRQPPAIIYRNIPVNISEKTRYIIKQVPVENKIFVKEGVPQPHKFIIKQIPVPIQGQIKIMTKQVPVYIRTPIPVRIPQIVEKIIPKTIIQQVPVLQPPKIIEKPVPILVQPPPKVIVRKVKIPVLDGHTCSPKVIVEKIPFPQAPKIITKPILVPVKVPPQVLVKQISVPYTRYVNTGRNCVVGQRSCVLPILPDMSICDKPEKYVDQLILSGCSSDDSFIFKNNLLGLLKKQLLCLPSNTSAVTQITHPPFTAPQNRMSLCQNLRMKLLKRLKYYSLQICAYRKVIKRMKHKLGQFLQSRLKINTVKSIQRPPVPIPMMHVMKRLSPSTPLNPLQHASSLIGVNSAAFVRDLHQTYKNTQEALTHCMDAILAQTLINSQIKTKCNNCHQLIQDKELAENQIRFLNSIIVDIQKKNEEQRARIEILESGCSPAMADELKLIGSSQRQVPPRVYCDICEEFDLHETEDCPKQNTDAVPFNGQRGQKILPERPYCEICESFGHATEDCQEDQTF